MGDLIVYIVIAAVALWIGWHVRGIVFMAVLSEDPDRIMNILKQIKAINVEERKEESDDTELFIERVGNTLYAYIKDTNQFVAQGNDLTDVLDTAHKRFPTRKFFGKIGSDNPAKELA